MAMLPVEELYLVTKDGKGAGKMNMWLDNEVVSFIKEEKEIVFDEELAIEVNEILTRYMTPLSAHAIRKTINREAGYKKVTTDEVTNILENVFLRAGVVNKKRVGQIDRYYIL